MDSRKSKIRIIFLALYISGSCFVNVAHAKLVTSVAPGGRWNTPGTWDNGVPAIGDDVLINHAVDIKNESINPGGDLYIVIGGGGSLNFTGGWGFLRLGGGSQIILEPGSSINGNGLAENILIGSTPAFNGRQSPDPFEGPTYLDVTTVVGGATYPPSDVPAVYDPLPVELLFFNATSDQDQVILSWSTASELNNDFFILEKSNNGRDFVKFGKVAGNGTTNLQVDYSFNDPSPYLGLSYYRLSQTDYDGTTEVFPVVSVLFQGNGSFAIAQNPVSGATIKLKISEMGNYELLELNIVDLQGRLVETKQLKADSFGNVDTEIQLKNPLRKGTYIFELASERRKEYLKVAAN